MDNLAWMLDYISDIDKIYDIKEMQMDAFFNETHYVNMYLKPSSFKHLVTQGVIKSIDDFHYIDYKLLNYYLYKIRMSVNKSEINQYLFDYYTYSINLKINPFLHNYLNTFFYDVVEAKLIKLNISAYHNKYILTSIHNELLPAITINLSVVNDVLYQDYCNNLSNVDLSNNLTDPFSDSFNNNNYRTTLIRRRFR